MRNKKSPGQVAFEAAKEWGAVCNPCEWKQHDWNSVTIWEAIAAAVIRDHRQTERTKLLLAARNKQDKPQ